MKPKKPAKAVLKRKVQMRSDFERGGRAFMESERIPYTYEQDSFRYTIPARTRNYYPDFKVGDTYYEFKGRWLAADRLKIQTVIHQNRGIKLVMVFMRPNNKIAKLSRTTYGEWCTRAGIPWMTFPEWQGHLLASAPRSNP